MNSWISEKVVIYSNQTQHMNLSPDVFDNHCINTRCVICIDENHTEEKCDWTTISFIATKANNQDLIFKLTQAGTMDWDAGLNGACKGNHTKLVKYIISKGAKITGHTFSFACEHPDTETLEILFSFLTPCQISELPHIMDFFQFLMQNNKVNIVFRLMEKSVVSEIFLFLEACEANSTIVAEAMIKRGGVNYIKTSRGIHTGFLSACVYGCLDIISMLIEKYQAKGFEDGMCWAVKAKQTNVILLLKKYGAYDGGLLLSRKNRVDELKHYLNQIVCRDILQTLSDFIDIEYTGDTYNKILSDLVRRSSFSSKYLPM